MLRRFLGSNFESAEWLRNNVPTSNRLNTLGEALFRVESGLVDRRLKWPTGDRLREQSDLHSWPFNSDDAFELLRLLRNDIPALNSVREACHGR